MHQIIKIYRATVVITGVVLRIGSCSSLMIGIGGTSVSSNPFQQSRESKEEHFIRRTFFAFNDKPREMWIAPACNDLFLHVGSHLLLPLLLTEPHAALCFSFTHFALDKSHNVGIEHRQDTHASCHIEAKLAYYSQKT